MGTNELNGKIQHGERLFLDGQFEAALRVFETVLEKEPGNVAALNDKGVALNKLGEFQEAIRTFSEVLDKDNANGNAAFNLTANYISIGNWKGAESTLMKYQHILPQEDAEMIKKDIERITTLRDSDAIKILTLSISSKSEVSSFRFSLDLNQFSQKIMWEHLAKGVPYEPEASYFILNVLEKGDCFIDIGAHIGYFSLLAASLVGPEGKVLSFEPEHSNYNHLKENIGLNGFNNIQIFKLALGSEDEEKQFFINLDNDGGHALWNVGTHPFNTKSRDNLVTRNIRVATLDHLLENEQLTILKFIKIDTEGAEHDILRGGINTIIKHRVPYILCEINRFGLNKMGTNENNLRFFLENIGYETHILIHHNSDTRIRRLSPNHFLKSQYVFNLLFVHEEAKLPCQCSGPSLNCSGGS